MIHWFNRHLIILFLKFGAVSVTFFGYSDFTVFAQIDSIVQQEIIQTEKEAVRLKNIWSEPTIRQSLKLYLQAANQSEKIKSFPNAARYLREAVKLKIMLAEEKSSVGLLQKSLSLEKKFGGAAGEAETFSLLTIIATKLGEKI